MSQLLSLSLKVGTLRNLPKRTDKNGNEYFDITISVDDKADRYGNNVSAWQRQSKEDREAKKERNFVGNGIVIYGHGKIERDGAAPANKPAPKKTPDESGLPF